MKVKIYQAPVEYNNKFMGYDFTMKHGGIDESQYKCVYDGEMEVSTPDDVFHICNTIHPIGYYGHSLSVSDIVVMDGRAVFCDSFGWKYIAFNGEGK